MRALERTYAKSERIIAKAKFTYWVFLLDFFVAAVLGAAMTCIWIYNLQIEQLFIKGATEVQFLTDANLKWALLGCGIFVVLFFACHAINRWSKEAVLTESKFVYRTGLLNIHTVSIQLYEVMDVEVHQHIIQSIMNVGTIKVIVDAGSPYVIKHIVAPDRFARRIMSQVTAVRGKR